MSSAIVIDFEQASRRLRPVRSGVQSPANNTLRERPSVVLPHPSNLFGSVCFDVETSGLYPDDGATVCAVGVAYRLNDMRNTIWHHGFAFDQGNAADKGFEVHYWPELDPTKKLTAKQREMDKYKYAGLPMGDPEDKWDWDTDYNLPIEQWVVLCRWLEMAGKQVGLINQELKFDLGHMCNGTRFSGGVELEKYAKWDTLLASQILFPYASTRALKPLGASLYGEAQVAEAEVVKQGLLEVKKRYGLRPEDGPRYDLLPWGINGPYVSQDTVLALRLAETQEYMIECGHGTAGQITKAVDLMRVLRRMERRGLGPLDVEQSRKIADEIDLRILDLKAKLPFTPHTGPAAATYFFDELGMAPWKVSEANRIVEWLPSKRKGATADDKIKKITQQGDCSAAVCHRMAQAGVPFAAEWAEITELTIVNRMFYRNYADLAGKDDRLRTNFKQAFVRSNRLSVERFQAQAIPKKLGFSLLGVPIIEPKKLFLTPPGRVRMNIDLAQAELRIAALFAGCDTMLNAVLSGADFHSMTTKRVLGVSEDHPEWDLKRDIGKRCTFASIFMVGPQTFRETLWKEAQINWSLGECKSLIYTWRDTYPEFQKAYYEWMEFAEKNQYVPLVDGAPSWMTQPRDFPNTAWNRRVQGSLALFARDWLIHIEKKTARMGALVLSVHDSVVLELPEAVADEVCAEIAEETAVLWQSMFGIPGRADVKRW